MPGKWDNLGVLVLLKPGIFADGFQWKAIRFAGDSLILIKNGNPFIRRISFFCLFLDTNSGKSVINLSLLVLIYSVPTCNWNLHGIVIVL